MNKFHEEAILLDQKDPLAKFKKDFISDGQTVYLDGNSLGRLPEKSLDISEDVIRNQWGERLIRSWNEHWLNLSKTVAGKIAKIVGAREDEIWLGDSTSLNLFKLAYAALEFQSGKKEILTDDLNFPTDLYILQGLVQNHFTGHHINQICSKDGISISKEQIKKNLSINTAMLTLSLVTYKSAFMYDMGEVNKMAHEAGSLVLWDLSHAAGAVPVYLNKTKADLAVGCTYKYLNGGPGAPAFLYVRKDLQEKLKNPIWSWFGHAEPFLFEERFTPAQGISKFAIGTPAIISTAAMEPGITLVLEAGIENLRLKSLKQYNFLLRMINSELIPYGFVLASPGNANERGSHLSLQHEKGFQICQAMIEPKNGSRIIIPDFRPPNNIRLGIAPLYTSFEELYEAVVRIREIMDNEEFAHFENAIKNVP